ncbi:MAG: YfhO family protein [Lachnospiraceae bacterium]|nr:YfhO family protein [Lachnospiraceae bacterium]
MKNSTQNIQMFKDTAKQTQKSSSSYSSVFLFTLIILFSAKCLYLSGNGTQIVGTLSMQSIIINSLASVCFFYYLKHTQILNNLSYIWQLLLSCGYGLCSYGIVQENSVSTLCLYAIFPIVFLSFEIMLKGVRHLPFLLLGTLALALDPESSIPIFLLLILLTIFELKLEKSCSLGNLCHKLSCFLLISLMAGFRIIPHLQSAYSLSGYSGFSTTCSLLVFLSRFLPGSTASIAYFTSNGMDMYFGLIFLFGFFLFFTMRNISEKKRIYYGIFSLIIVASLWISPIRFVFNLCSEPGSFSLSYSFFLIFWCLKLASESISNLREVHVTDLHISVLLTALFIVSSWIGSSHNFFSAVFPVILIIFAVFVAFLYTNYKGNGAKKLFKALFCSLILVEFFLNAYCITNTDFIPSSRSLNTAYIWDILSTSKTVAFTDTTFTDSASKATSDTQLSSKEAYTDFTSTHVNTETNELINQLTELVSVNSSELKKYTKKALPNYIEELNALCYKIGATEDLFTPFDATIVLADSELYSFTSITDTIFNMDLSSVKSAEPCFYVPFTVKSTETLPDNLYLFNDTSGELFQLTDSAEQNNVSGYTSLTNLINANTNFQLLTFILNEDLAEKLPALLESYNNEQAKEVSLGTVTYVSVIVSSVGLLLFLCLYFNSDKEKVYAVLLSIKKALDNWKLPKRITSHLSENRIYYWAFFIPFLFYIGNMVMTNCVPFGNNSFFDEDGIALTLPSYMDLYYSLKDGNTYLSMNGGYGANIYANTPLVQLFSFYKFFSPDQIAPLLLLGEAFCFGLCGFAMTFYMTHRLRNKNADKTDFRLLVPALIYALNAYMLSMHNYTGWYFTLFAFPLLILAMDYLMYKKKTLPYVLLLTYCIITNLYLALYMCIFLVIYFFTYHFEGIKDLFTKGIRFALCSLLAAGNSFFVISNTLLSTYDSPYNKNDSVFPSIGLHTSFLEQWKKHMIFTSSNSVSSDNGMLNIYCGILSLFLILIYFSAKNISLKTKLKKIIPIVLLYISFNEQVLSFIWNGLHYQTKVPNRFVFLLLFLLAEIAYDGICQIKSVSIKKYTLLTGILIVFFLICQFCSNGNSSYSWIITLIFCLIYLVFHMFFMKYKQTFYSKLLVGFLILELGLNMTYAIGNFEHNYMLYYGDYCSIEEDIRQELSDDSDYFRSSFPASWLSNTGQIYHTGANSLFNSFVSQHQLNTNGIYGFYASGNLMTSNHISTPLGMSLSSSRYIFLPKYATGITEGLQHYNYIGTSDIYYVFENPNAFSLGIYAPFEAAHLDSLDFVPDFFNDLISLYTKSDKPLYITQYLEYDDTESLPNSFYFSDGLGNTISLDEAADIYLNKRNGNSFSSLKELRIHVTYIPEANGFAYLCASELAPLTKCKAGETVTKEIYFPNSFTELRSAYNYIIMDTEVLKNFFAEAAKNQLENISIINDTITGTTNYEKDGYTMLSLAWDRNWHAYIDGSEVEIEDPYNSFMMIKTPAGKHTLELRYIPYGMKVCKGISLGFWILTVILYVTNHLLKHRKKPSLSE